MKTINRIFIILVAAVTLSHAAELPVPSVTSEIKHLFSISDSLLSPMRITITSDDLVYISDVTGNKIGKYNLQGDLLAVINLPITPLAISITKGKQIFIGDKSGQLQQFDQAGSLLKPAPNPFGISNLPVDAVIDRNDNIYLVDSNNKMVKLFDGRGNLIRSFGSDIMTFPTSIALDEKNNRILVADHGGLFAENGTDGLIHVFDLQGNYQKCIAEFGTKPGQFSRIHGITVDRSGHILAADPFQGKVTILDKNGIYLGTIGKFGSEAGEFQMPMGIAVDSKNQLWVASTNTGRVEVFSLGDPVSTVAASETAQQVRTAALLQNFPNPFKNGTWIPFVLNKTSHVKIKIFNGVGRLVRTIDAGTKDAGIYDSKSRAIYWDGRNNEGRQLSSGLYFCKFTADSFSAMKRLVLLK